MSMQPQPEKKGWQSVRTILESLILLTLAWCGNALIDAGKQIAVLTDRVTVMNQTLVGVPELGTRVTKLELQVEQDKQDIHELRQLKGLP